MNKRTWITVIALVASLLIAATGTLAYLTDTDSDVNVMTLGNVDIEQHEMKRVDGVAYNDTLEEGDLEPFEDGIKLYPAYPLIEDQDMAYEAMQDEADCIHWGPYVHGGTAWNGLFSEEKVTGAVDKMIFVENTGDSDAYVRTLLAIESPEGVDIGYGWQHADIVLNMNGNNRFNNSLGTGAINSVCAIDVNGTHYEVYEFCYSEIMKPGEWTRPSLLQVVMTHWADNEDMKRLGDTFEILALSQGVQVENLTGLGAQGALDAAFGKVTKENATKWFSKMEGMPVTTASTAEELAAALAEGGTVVLTNDIELTDEPIKIAKGTDATIVIPEGVTIEGTSTNSSASNQLVVESGATLTLSGAGELSFTAGKPDTDWGENGPKPYPGYASNTIKNSGKLIIDGVTVKNNTGRGGASYAIDNYPGADLIVNSGSIQQTGGDVAIRMFANSKTVPTNVTINGGTIEGKRAVWVQIPGSDPTVAMIANLTVNGGTLTSTDDPTANYLAIYSYSYGNSFANTNIALNGGTYNGHVAFGGGYKGDTENVTVTGGTFNGELGRYLANDGWEDIPKP
ncbi:MAG: SipW-dependent-type signal peptide-containing protein [Clostridia bacterium]|nr:SipW-dependent-type signal peptide-containing protein [Clostridia bacterium]